MQRFYGSGSITQKKEVFPRRAILPLVELCNLSLRSSGYVLCRLGFHEQAKPWLHHGTKSGTKRVRFKTFCAARTGTFSAKETENALLTLSST